MGGLRLLGGGRRSENALRFSVGFLSGGFRWKPGLEVTAALPAEPDGSGRSGEPAGKHGLGLELILGNVSPPAARVRRQSPSHQTLASLPGRPCAHAGPQAGGAPAVHQPQAAV